MRSLDSYCWVVPPYDSFCNRSAIGWQYLLCLIPGRVEPQAEVEVRCAMVVWVRLFPPEKEVGALSEVVQRCELPTA